MAVRRLTAKLLSKALGSKADSGKSESLFLLRRVQVTLSEKWQKRFLPWECVVAFEEDILGLLG